MKCVDIEALLCDYVDGALGQPERAEVDTHIASCDACAELLADSQSAVRFMSGVAPLEAPPELVTRILYRTHGAKPQHQEVERPRGWFSRLFQPILQPRFAMGMAMTILSFSMIGKMAGIPQRRRAAAFSSPSQITQRCSASRGHKPSAAASPAPYPSTPACGTSDMVLRRAM